MAAEILVFAGPNFRIAKVVSEDEVNKGDERTDSHIENVVSEYGMRSLQKAMRSLVFKL